MVIRTGKSKKDQTTQRPREKGKRTNDLQNTSQKTKDRAIRTPLKTNNDLQNTSQKTKDRAIRTPLKILQLKYICPLGTGP